MSHEDKPRDLPISEESWVAMQGEQDPAPWKLNAELLGKSAASLQEEVIKLQEDLAHARAEVADLKERLGEEPRRARVTAEMPADSLIALAGLGDWKSIPSDHPAGLAARGLGSIVRYAPAGKRVRVRMEWEVETPDWDREPECPQFAGQHGDRPCVRRPEGHDLPHRDAERFEWSE